MQPEPPPALERRLLLAVALSLLILVVGRHRGLTDLSIFHHDETLYLVQGMVWAEGLLPYRDCWVNKPPLVPAVFGLVDGVFGPGLLPHRLVQIACLAGASLAAAAVACSWRGSRAVVPAAVLSALLAGTRLPAGDLLPCLAEALFVLPLTLSALSLLRRLDAPPDGRALARDLALSGLALGAAVQLRQNALLFVPLYLAAAGAHPRLGPRPAAASRLVAVAALGGGLLASLLPSLIALREVVPELHFWSWTHPRANHVFEPLVLLRRAPGLLGPNLLMANPGPTVLAAAGAVGLLAALRRARGAAWRDAYRAAFLLAWGGVGALALPLLGGRPYPHYLIMLAPGFGVLGAAAWLDAHDRLVGWRRSAGRALVCLACAYAAWACASTAWYTRRGGGWEGIEQLEQAERSELLQLIDRTTQPWERIAVVGACPALYYRARRLPAAPDVSGEILSMRFVKAATAELRPPGPDGEPTSYHQLLTEGIVRHATLVVDLSGLEHGDRVAGIEPSWFAQGKLEQLPVVARFVREHLRELPGPVEGARVYVRTRPGGPRR